MSTKKQIVSGSEAVSAVTDGSSIAVGGFGNSGMPFGLVDALLEHGARGLHLISNNCGSPGEGLSNLIEAGLVARMTMSYMGQNPIVAQMYLSGALEVEFVPQGTLAEKLRAGAAGLPAFYTPTGRGTLVETGGLPIKYDSDGTPVVVSDAKQTEQFGEEVYLLEESIRPDFAFVKAHLADQWGNLRFRVTARNFNPIFAMAARHTIVETDSLLQVEPISGDDVHLSGVFVDRLVFGRVDAGQPAGYDRRLVDDLVAG